MATEMTERERDNLAFQAFNEMFDALPPWRPIFPKTVFRLRGAKPDQRWVDDALQASWRLRSAADGREAEMIARRDRFDALPAGVFVGLR